MSQSLEQDKTIESSVLLSNGTNLSANQRTYSSTSKIGLERRQDQAELAYADFKMEWIHN